MCVDQPNIKHIALLLLLPLFPAAIALHLLPYQVFQILLTVLLLL